MLVNCVDDLCEDFRQSLNKSDPTKRAEIQMQVYNN